MSDTLFSIAQGKIAKRKKHRFKFNWAGGLADAYPGMTAVELQHKTSEWR